MVVWKYMLVGLSLALSAPLRAEPLPLPATPAILEVTGAIGTRNAGDKALFDRKMLEDLGMVSIKTKTPWHAGVSHFEGVPLEALMASLDARGETLTATALNDYVTEIPIRDFAEYGPILALKRNGSYMSVREHGPLFIIYPFDDEPDLQSQTFYARAAWQVSKLHVE